MKNLEYYMKLPYKLEVIQDVEEGGYVARYPELPGCVTCSDSVEGLLQNAEDAKKSWLTACLEEKLDIPEPERDSNYSGQFKLRMPKSLHKSLAEHSKQEGISMNQYCLYLLSKNDAIYEATKEKIVSEEIVRYGVKPSR